MVQIPQEEREHIRSLLASVKRRDLHYLYGVLVDALTVLTLLNEQVGGRGVEPYRLRRVSRLAQAIREIEPGLDPTPEPRD